EPAPPAFAITNAFPSPSTSVTSIEYTLPAPGRVRVSVHDVPGRTVAVLRDEDTGSGRHTETWNGISTDGTVVSPGIYVVRVEYGGRIATRRIVRLR
ncbi:MAG TPA: T9SS type A sorting domain-containing protein, partial [bacterium]|nr:T9SS type A sorting domain-containing protein [bacterium]